MGCCAASNRSIPEQALISKILRAIDSQSFRTFTSIYETLQKLRRNPNLINEKIDVSQGLNLNCLGYAMYKGKSEMFAYIHKIHAASIQIMENLLNSSNTTSLHIICSRGYISILKYFLPYYLEDITEYPVIQEVSSIFRPDSFLVGQNKEVCPQYLPVHSATCNEDVALLSYIHQYFIDKSYIPHYLDLEYKEESTGENCVLIACRIASFKMIKFFHQSCRLNFRVKNHADLNAINVLIEGAKELNNKSCFNCLRYLVETVGVDYEHKYLFNLCNTKDHMILEYLIEKLKEIGVNIAKSDIGVERTMTFGVIKNTSENNDTGKPNANLYFSELKYRCSRSVEYTEESF